MRMDRLSMVRFLQSSMAPRSEHWAYHNPKFERAVTKPPDFDPPRDEALPNCMRFRR